MSKDEIVKLASQIGKTRLRHTSELEMQEDLERWLKQSGIEFVREARLSAEDRVDFLVGSIAVECKIKGPAMGVFRQIGRYLKSDKVSGVILLTAFHMGLPEEIGGKPCQVVKAGTPWL